MRVRNFDLDHNLFLTNSKVTVEQEIDGQRQPIRLSHSEIVDLKNKFLLAEEFEPTIPGSGRRRLNENARDSYHENHDDLDHEALPKALQNCDFTPGPALDAAIEAISRGEIFALTTARGHRQESLRQTLRDFFRQKLSPRPNFSETLKTLKKNFHAMPDDAQDLRNEYFLRMDFFGTNCRILSQKMRQNYTEFPELGRDDPRAKAIIFRHHISTLETQNPAQYRQSHDEREYSFSDDSARNIDAILDEAQKLKKSGKIQKFHKLVLFHTGDPDAISKTTLNF